MEKEMYYEFQASAKGFLFPTVVSAQSFKVAIGKALRSVKLTWANDRETVGLLRTDEIDLDIENVTMWRQ